MLAAWREQQRLVTEGRDDLLLRFRQTRRDREVGFVRVARNARRVCEQMFDRDRLPSLRAGLEVLADGIADGELPRVLQLHHERGSELLGDRSEPELGLDPV